jgi:hypothetical protein
MTPLSVLLLVAAGSNAAAAPVKGRQLSWGGNSSLCLGQQLHKPYEAVLVPCNATNADQHWMYHMIGQHVVSTGNSLALHAQPQDGTVTV